MQYILTQEEYKELERKDSRFEPLTIIMHNILELNCSDRIKFNLIAELNSALAYASQDGTTDVVLFNWSNKTF